MKKISRVEMKNLMGGGNAPASSCTASCTGGTSVTKDCGANSICKAIDNVGAKCNDDTPTCCYAGVPCVV